MKKVNIKAVIKTATIISALGLGVYNLYINTRYLRQYSKLTERFQNLSNKYKNLVENFFQIQELEIEGLAELNERVEKLEKN